MDQIRKKGITVNSSFLRETGDLAKNLNVIDPSLKTNRKEVLSFIVALSDEVYSDFKRRVSVKTSKVKNFSFP
jgi:hypothetical protein